MSSLETNRGAAEAPGPGETATPALTQDADVTIVFPVQSQKARIEEVLGALGGALERLGMTWEAILVYDGIKGEVYQLGTRLQEETQGQLRTIALHRPFGESVCLSSAFEHARGALVVTTPQYVQIDPAEIEKLFQAIDDGADFVTTWRHPRVDSRLNQMQSSAFNWVVRKVVGARFHDL
ncbi:MAG: glycosyltransferase, partial [Planctomycetota bacterium]